MVNHKYRRIIEDHCAYVCKFVESKFIIFLLYIDNMSIVEHDSKIVDKLKEEMS